MTGKCRGNFGYVIQVYVSVSVCVCVSVRVCVCSCLKTKNIYNRAMANGREGENGILKSEEGI